MAGGLRQLAACLGFDSRQGGTHSGASGSGGAQHDGDAAAGSSSAGSGPAQAQAPLQPVALLPAQPAPSFRQLAIALAVLEYYRSVTRPEWVEACVLAAGQVPAGYSLEELLLLLLAAAQMGLGTSSDSGGNGEGSAERSAGASNAAVVATLEALAQAAAVKLQDEGVALTSLARCVRMLEAGAQPGVPLWFRSLLALGKRCMAAQAVDTTRRP